MRRSINAILSEFVSCTSQAPSFTLHAPRFARPSGGSANWGISFRGTPRRSSKSLRVRKGIFLPNIFRTRRTRFSRPAAFLFELLRSDLGRDRRCFPRAQSFEGLVFQRRFEQDPPRSTRSGKRAVAARDKIRDQMTLLGRLFGFL